MNSASTLARSERILAQQAEDTVVLLDPESGQYYTLEEVGARIWELSDGTRNVGQMVEIIRAEYDAPAATIQADVLELVAELADERLVVEI